MCALGLRADPHQARPVLGRAEMACRIRIARWTKYHACEKCAWAKAQGYSAVTLSTFRDVPWYGPFYRKRGFRDLAAAEWTPDMQSIREREVQHGLRVEARVFMRLEMDGPSSWWPRGKDLGSLDTWWL